MKGRTASTSRRSNDGLAGAGRASVLQYDGAGRLLAWFALSFATGALLYFSLTRDPSLPVVVSAAGTTVASLSGLLATVRFGRIFPQQGLILIVVAGLAGGFVCGELKVRTTSTTTLQYPLDQVMIEGWIEGVDPRATGSRLRLYVHAISGLEPGATPEHVRMTVRERPDLTPGRFVRCYGMLRPPPSPSIAGDFDFRRDAFFDGLGGVGYVFGRCNPGSLGTPSDRRLEFELAAFRRVLAERVEAASGERAGGFAAALVSGDRSLMREDDREALRASGLAHLLAISGLHLGLVGGMVYVFVWRVLAFWPWLALRVPVQKPAAVAALGCLAIYFALSGMSVATQRAFIMAVVFFGAILIDRSALTIRALAIAMLLVTALQPEAVLTPGYQMSFAATGALIATYAAWTRRNRAIADRQARNLFTRLRVLVASIFVTALVGGAATAPAAFFHFERLASFGLLANVLAMPVVSFLSVPAAGLALVLLPFGQAELGLQLFGKSLELVLSIAHWTASLSGTDKTVSSGLSAMPGPVLYLSLAAIAVFSIHNARARLLPALLFAVSALIWLRTPVEHVVLDANGYLYVRSEQGAFSGQWLPEDRRETLPPLRFAEAPDLQHCETLPCRLPLTEDYHVTLSQERLQDCAAERTDDSTGLSVAEPAVWLSVRDTEGLCLGSYRHDWQSGLSTSVSGPAPIFFIGDEPVAVSSQRLPMRKWSDPLGTDN